MKFDLIHWAFAHGIIMGSKLLPSEDPTNVKAIHAPFSLSSYKYPIKAFLKAEQLATIFNNLIDIISRDENWLHKTLHSTVENDDFTRRLMRIFDVVLKEGIREHACLGINRSDYMLHEAENDCRDLLQVEINTISSSFGALSTKIAEMFRAFEKNHNIPVNRALDDIPLGIYTAHKYYMDKHSKSDAIILMIVQPGERNFADQRFLHFELQTKYKCTVVRATFEEIHDHGKLDEVTRELTYKNQPVSVCYFRAGYTPNDYIVTGTNKEWDARLLMERSIAVKCPTIGYHLAGTKKVQQALALPGVLEELLLNPNNAKYNTIATVEEDIALLRSVFAGLYSLDPLEMDKNIKQLAINNPHAYVLKPQREGGGNNLYNQELVHALQTMNENELSAYILMERILPPAQKAVLIKDCTDHEVMSLCELGIFGVYFNAHDGKTPVLNNYSGYLLRVKPSNVDEGGVAAGFAALSAPDLI